MIELMSGELIASAEALLTALAGEWFLRLGETFDTSSPTLTDHQQNKLKPLTNPVCLHR